MELGSVFLILAVLVIAGIYLYAPFTERVRQVDIDESHEVSGLKAERDRVINSLQELDFDFKLGKVPAEDYPEQRANLLQRGAEILRQLDEFEPASSLKKIEDHIEKNTSASQLDNAEIEAMLAERRKAKQSKSAGFCPKCGKPVLVTDKFCPSCGKAL
ncbi:MAG: zinc-ribbon domain-containing protein [Anaerolineales bacterium]|nr:zinc-ribbon domain-containing protein [Anaerolineales bacterium]